MRRTYRVPARIDDVDDTMRTIFAEIGAPWATTLNEAATIEAVLNALIHGVLRVSTGPERDPIAFVDALHAAESAREYEEVRVTVDHAPGSADYTIVVSDPGDGFDTRAAVTKLATVDPLASSGRGLLLMHAAAERVSWNAVGNEVTLRFVTPPASTEPPRPPKAAPMKSRIPPALNGRIERARAVLSRVATLLPLEMARLLGPRVRRTVDVVAGIGGFVIVSPVLAAAAVAIKATSPGSVLYGQMRIGKGGRPFRLRKLRTMYVDADARLASLGALNESRGGVTFKIRKDPRITPVGRVLRKFSVDEMPQLWNLLDGTMTLFGPRPPVASEVAKYGHRQRRRLEVTPGITCLWQVSGRSDLSFEEQVALDITYIDRTRPIDEIIILAKTIPAVLTGRGAY